MFLDTFIRAEPQVQTYDLDQVISKCACSERRSGAFQNISCKIPTGVRFVKSSTDLLAGYDLKQPRAITQHLYARQLRRLITSYELAATIQSCDRATGRRQS